MVSGQLFLVYKALSFLKRHYAFLTSMPKDGMSVKEIQYQRKCNQPAASVWAGHGYRYGLLKRVKDGRNTYYRFNPAEVKRLERWAKKLFSGK